MRESVLPINTTCAYADAMFHSSKSQFRETIPDNVFPIEKFLFLVLARNTIKLKQLIIHYSLHYLSSGRLREIKNKGDFKLLALEVVAVAFERWSLTRGSIYSDLTWKLVVFWKTGR